MNDSREQHEPTQEFTDFLARDIKRTLRHHARFAPSPRVARARRLAVILGSALGTVAVLAIGLVFGTSTGYASAQVETDRQRDAMAVNAATLSTQLTELRFNLARARAELTSSAAGARAGLRATLEAASAELRTMEASLERIEGDLAQGHTEKTPARATTPRKTTPVTRALAATCNALALCADTTPAQQAIVTVELPAATARSTELLWNVLGVREFANGKLLVNDAGGRQLRLYDASLASSVVVLDSTSGTANSYGTRRVPLARFIGDSAMLPDVDAHALRIIDANGRVARSVALGDAPVQLTAPLYADEKGRVLFSGSLNWQLAGVGGDSMPIMRFDPTTRRIDTVGRVRSSGWPGGYLGLDGRLNRAVSWNPSPRLRLAGKSYDFEYAWLPGGPTPIVPEQNVWAVLNDGSIAIVRGHDYHIDWIRPDGRASTGAKLPFDWQALADEGKRQMLDSAYLHQFVTMRGTFRQRVLDTTILRSDSLAQRVKTFSYFLRGPKPRANLVPAAADGAAMPDADGNLWLLPSAPMDSTNPGLVYDVVNARGDLTMRVRIPADRAIGGFGKGGTVYLIAGDRANGFYIERTKVPALSARR